MSSASDPAAAVRGPSRLTETARPDERARLRRLSQEMEGVFLNQLFQAMRASVTRSGLTDVSQGEQIFTSLLDERLADEAATRMERGIGEALYRQLARRLPPAPDGEKR